MQIIDGQLDLAMNALLWNRDLTQSISAIRTIESGLEEKARGNSTVSLPQMREGRIAVCFAAVLHRTSPAWRTGSNMDASAQSITYAQARGQLAYYELLESQGEMRQIKTQSDLENHWKAWDGDQQNRPPIGYILRIEGADPILSADMVDEWWSRGMRSLSLAHFGLSSYAHGTGSSGGLLPRAAELLNACANKGVLIDLTHLSDESFWEVMDQYPGQVCASHQNCRALVPGDRQMDDSQLKELIARDGVVGTALKGRSLHADWPDSLDAIAPPVSVTLNNVADHISHVCGLAGNTQHAAIGSDLDGGYGNEETPQEINTIADLSKLADVLSERNFSDRDINNIMFDNWLRLLKHTLPA